MHQRIGPSNPVAVTLAAHDFTHLPLLLERPCYMCPLAARSPNTFFRDLRVRRFAKTYEGVSEAFARSIEREHLRALARCAPKMRGDPFSLSTLDVTVQDLR